tara:strand:- start:460 stop:678 length:219 start_codon:yes stop_codon:yes gene_type:complete
MSFCNLQDGWIRIHPEKSFNVPIDYFKHLLEHSEGFHSNLIKQIEELPANEIHKLYITTDSLTGLEIKYEKS